MYRKNRSNPTLVVLLASLAGCSAATETRHETAVVGSSAALTIGPEGGSIVLGGARLSIPAGALHEAQEIRITVSSEAGPTAFGHFSPVYRIEPEGLVLDAPAHLTIPFEGRDDVATVFHHNERTAAYIAEQTQVNADLAGADLAVLGRAFVGSGTADASACRPATGELDVLLAVDNSGSMTEEQVALAAALPRLARVLASGDIDADGVQDFPAASSIQWGNITTDLGSGAFYAPGCNSGGDEAALRTLGAADDSSCASSYPGVLRFDGYAAGADVDAFAHDVACVARAGTSGCGFEQPLEASLRALAPSSSELSFFGSSSGQGDLANAGLVRESSVLAVINLTDEDDGSVNNPDLLNPVSSAYPGELNIRTYQYPEALQPVSRYVDGLIALSGDPGRLVYAAVAGVPQDLVADPGSIDYAAVLADPRMQYSYSAEYGALTVVPACESAVGGRALPSARVVETAQGLDARGVATVIQSICADNLDAAANAILVRIARRLAGSCE